MTASCPKVNIRIQNYLLKKYKFIKFKLDAQLAYIYINGEPIKEIDHVTSLHQGSNAGQTGLKRAMNSGINSDDEDSKKGKTMDIYKQRQYKKLMQNTLWWIVTINLTYNVNFEETFKIGTNRLKK